MAENMLPLYDRVLVVQAPLQPRLNMRDASVRWMMAFISGILMFIAGVIIIGTADTSSISTFLLGKSPRTWYDYKYLLIIGAIDYAFLSLLAGWMPNGLRIWWPFRIALQSFFGVIAAMAAHKFDNLESAYAPLFVSLHTIPLFKLINTVDDTSFFECFLALSVCGIIGHFGRNFECWVVVSVLIVVMTTLKTGLAVLFEKLELVPAGPAEAIMVRAALAQAALNPAAAAAAAAE